MLATALKEWDAVTRALAAGRQIMLLRKGGIHETEGVFEIEHRSFVFYPTFIHQHPDWLKPADRADYSASLAARGIAPTATEDPPHLTFTTTGTITDILPVRTRPQLDALSAHHIWLPPMLDMRWNYKPHNPLYVLLVRAAVLATPVTAVETPAYAGCRSWVPLDTPIDASTAGPALADAAYQAARAAITAALA